MWKLYCLELFDVVVYDPAVVSAVLIVLSPVLNTVLTSWSTWATLRLRCRDPIVAKSTETQVKSTQALNSSMVQDFCSLQQQCSHFTSHDYDEDMVAIKSLTLDESVAGRYRHLSGLSKLLSVNLLQLGCGFTFEFWVTRDQQLGNRLVWSIRNQLSYFPLQK